MIVVDGVLRRATVLEGKGADAQWAELMRADVELAEAKAAFEAAERGADQIEAMLPRAAERFRDLVDHLEQTAMH
ncbi:MAG TPA: hypothetical protein VF502_16605, partial [Stellaceae bacterium]